MIIKHLGPKLKKKLYFQTPGATNLRMEISRTMDFFINTTLKQYRLDRTSHPNQVRFLLNIHSIVI